MKKTIEKISDKAWLPPGSLVYVGQVKNQPIRIVGMDYDESGCEEWEGVTVDEKLPTKKKEVHWIHLDGVHQPEVVKSIGEIYGIHALTLEDILNTEHRPKLDETDECFFLIVKQPVFNEERALSFRSISILLGNFGVISFTDTDEDLFKSVRSRIRSANGRIRKQGPDYLLYSLLDTVIDSYLVVMDQIQEEILQLEEKVLHNAESDSLQQLQNLQRTVLQLQQVIRPSRDLTTALCRIDDPFINESTKKYFEDVLDHILAISANTDHFREMLSSILNLYISMMNTKMNQVVHLLTVFAAIFMPLTFIAGIYGMNFKYMPELDHPYGYFITLFLMLVVVISMILFFRQKKWL